MCLRTGGRLDERRSGRLSARKFVPRRMISFNAVKNFDVETAAIFFCCNFAGGWLHAALAPVGWCPKILGEIDEYPTVDCEKTGTKAHERIET